ncbi:hypothetical protein Poly30_52050 [Planctomycetes bacterium Poly30]|uniref:Uncharacterized protein n=1 Tax=Saltatorellus ferox TaxID=2528018 RepID=A0A518EZY3_9BACT|nr:hypothetical protein Poly30_52050 [Planctomycetes bacterium Poly30]
MVGCPLALTAPMVPGLYDVALEMLDGERVLTEVQVTAGEETPLVIRVP